MGGSRSHGGLAQLPKLGQVLRLRQIAGLVHVHLANVGARLVGGAAAHRGSAQGGVALARRPRHCSENILIFFGKKKRLSRKRCQRPSIFRGIFQITKLSNTSYIPKEYAEYRRDTTRPSVCCCRLLACLLIPLTYLPYGCSNSGEGPAGAKVPGAYASLDGPSFRGWS